VQSQWFPHAKARICTGVGPFARKSRILVDTWELVGGVEKDSSGSPGNNSHALARSWGNRSRCWTRHSARASGTSRVIVVLEIFSVTHIICAVK